MLRRLACFSFLLDYHIWWTFQLIFLYLNLLQSLNWVQWTFLTYVMIKITERLTWECKVVPDLIGKSILHQECCKTVTLHQKSEMNSEGNGSSNALTTTQNSTRILNQERCSIGGSSLTSSQICPPPLCRQFWKAGNYDDGFSSKPTHKSIAAKR